MNPINFTDVSVNCGGTRSNASQIDDKDGLWPSKDYIRWLNKNDNGTKDHKMGSRVYWGDQQQYIIVAEIFFMIGSVTLSGQAIKLCQLQKEMGIMNAMLYKTARHLAFFFLIFFM